ncbi:MAG: hypothetical protein Q8M26_01970 [Pseudolabrys sp.]|nr:hypothetical protein [Pseudolabrys sp.]
MIVATRSLLWRTEIGAVEIPVRIFAPEKAAVDWICRFEIDWPSEKAERWGAGIDAMQALLIALQMIGAEVYASKHHRSGQLEWLTPGHGYGFPVASNIRDLLVGDDRRYL